MPARIHPSTRMPASVDKACSPNLTLTGDVSMKLEAAKFVVMLVVFGLAVPDSLNAQTADASLSGTVTAPSGLPVANARVSVKNVSTGESAETQTDSTGKYSIKNLTSADYEVTAHAEGFAAKTATPTLAAGAEQTVDVALSAAPAEATPAAQQNLPNAPSSSKTE